MRARRSLRSLLFRLDIDVRRYRSNAITWRRMRYLSQRGLTAAFDVGANRGQYAEDLRRGGFTGKIVSFEPLPSPFEELQAKAQRDPAWTVCQLAIGSASSIATFHIAGNVDSSSLLPMLARHVEGAPMSGTTETITVDVVRLDDIAPDLVGPADRLLLKMDVQGYEKHVLEGAAATLDQVDAIECELSFVPLYEGQALATEMLTLLSDLGFELVWLEPGFTDEHTEQLLQADGIFLRRRNVMVDGDG